MLFLKDARMMTYAMAAHIRIPRECSIHTVYAIITKNTTAVDIAVIAEIAASRPDINIVYVTVNSVQTIQNAADKAQAPINWLINELGNIF